ncbi:hypothetical protein IJ384_03740 [bacterium]|nr:hypothetical protein [bacterium]
MEIKGTNVNLNQKIKKDSQAGKKLAKEIMLFADDNSSAVSKSEFQTKLNKIENLSTQDLIKFIRGFDKDESIIELICDEIGDDKKVRKEACKKVLNALVNKAKELGIDTFDFENQFNTELNIQFRMIGFINTEKLDSIINALTQSIENRQNLTSEDLQTIQNTSAEVGQEQANGVIENLLEKAYSAFGERVGEDGEMTTKDKDGKTYNGRMQRDGIAADIADGVSRIWGSENTAAKVRKDLKASNAQLQQLKEAKLQGEEAYKAKFKEIFGVEYDYANILAYQKAETTYINASANHEFEMSFNRTLKTLLSPAPLREETESVVADPSTNTMISTITATKEQVFEREFNNLAEFLTQKDANGNEINGGEILNRAFEEKGVANGTMEEKFEVLKQIAKALSKELHKSTLEAGGGKEFSEVQAMYDNSYKAAYGVENNIMKRVTDYNVSQEIGGAFTKMGAILVTTYVTAGLGGGLIATAAATSLATVGYEVIDRGTSGKALDALREQGLGEYLETTLKDVDWEATLKQAAMSGGAVLIGGAVAQGVTAIMKGHSTVAQFAAMLGADVITDATMEFFMTKQITWEGMVFTVLLSTIGNAVQLNQMKKATTELGMKMINEDGVTINERFVEGHIEEVHYRYGHDPDDYSIGYEKVKPYYELELTTSGGQKKSLKFKDKKSFNAKKDEIINGYIQYKQSGLDFETFFNQKDPNIVAELTVKDAKIARYNELAAKHPDVATELQRIGYTSKHDRDFTYYPEHKWLKILETYDADPQAGLAMLRSDFIPTESLYGCVDDAKRLAYSAKGQNSSAIKQYAFEVEDYARQAVALRAEGKITEAHNVAQKALERAKNISRLASENPYMITNVTTAEEVGNIAEQALSGAKYRIATAGYSAPPAGYEDVTKSFMKALDGNLHQPIDLRGYATDKTVGYITSPTADAGSIDAITTEIAGFKEGRIFYTTAQDYVDYINPANFPKDINTTAYLDAPKYVLPDGASYSQATAAASNTFIATGGRAATVSDFCNAIEKGNLAVILDNTALDAPAWGTRPGKTNPEVLNASRYLKEQTDAFLAGKPLPYPETGNFTIEFMNTHKNDLTNLVRVVATDGTEASIEAAAKQAARYISEPRSFGDFVVQITKQADEKAPYGTSHEIRSRVAKYDKIVEQMYNTKNPDGSCKFTVEQTIEILRGNESDVMLKLINAGVINNPDPTGIVMGTKASTAVNTPQQPKINQLFDTDRPGQKALVTIYEENPNEAIVTFINDGFAINPQKLPIEKLSHYGIEI